MKLHASLSTLLHSYFTQRLMDQLHASPHTVASYRDTFRLLLLFAQERLGKAPTLLTPQDLDASFIGSFLHHLEKDRKNTAASRNIRLAAIHSFFKFVALQEPTLGALAQRVLAIPCKRRRSKPIDFLTRPEIEALLAAPDQATRTGRRDRTLLLVATQTGLRAAELIGLRCQDVVLGCGAHVRCLGKGRRERCTPLRKDAVAALRSWLREREACPSHPVFPNARGQPLSHDGLAYILAKHVATARSKCPSLAGKRITPHVLRHSLAMDLLQNGVDRSVIALWLGHQSMETTQIYLHANLELKEQALAKTKQYKGRTGRFRPTDQLLAFLKEL